ncbi:MAG: SpoIIE family protein phosphatase [bacterium]|nr:SpoIIE family protein phosphatase [bacterium]
MGTFLSGDLRYEKGPGLAAFSPGRRPALRDLSRAVGFALAIALSSLPACMPAADGPRLPPDERISELPLVVDGEGRPLFDASGVDWRRNGAVRLRRWSSYVPASGTPGASPDPNLSVPARRILIRVPVPAAGERPPRLGLRLLPYSAGYRLVPGDRFADAYIVDARLAPRLRSRTLYLTPREGFAGRLEIRLIGAGQVQPAAIRPPPDSLRGTEPLSFGMHSPAARPVLRIGSAAQMHAVFELNQAWYAFILGAFGLIGLSYVSLWFARRSEGSFLLFGLFCLLVAIVVSVSGDRFLFAYLNDSAGFPIHSIFIDRLQLLAVTFVVPVFFHFVCELFAGPRWKLAVRIAYGVAVCIGIILLMAPPPSALIVLGIYRAWSVAIVALALWVLVRAWRADKPGAKLALPGVAILVAAGIYDMFAVAGTEHGGLVLFAPALFLFVLVQGAMLSRRFTWAFAMFESISNKLQRTAGSPENIEALHLELDTARGIQQSLIPVAPPEVPGLRIAARYRAMQIVGGDFYDFRTNLPEAAGDSGEVGGEVGVLLADVSGHGIPAALIVSMVKLAFWYQKTELPPPGTLFERMNDLLRDNISGEFVTGCYAHLDLEHMVLSTSNAGHPPLFLLKRASGELIELRPNGRLLGLMPNAQFDVERVEVEQGDRVILYTDGVYEAARDDDTAEQFGLDRFKAFISANETLSPDRFSDKLMRTVIDWSGGVDHIGDDIAFVVIDIAADRVPRSRLRWLRRARSTLLRSQ